MKEQHKGHVQVEFERRTGRTLADWLAEHGPSLTRAAAAREIGYTAPNALSGFVRRYMPEDFKFYARPVRFTVEQVTEANARHEAGETWRQIAVSMGGNIQALKDACRRRRNGIGRGKRGGAPRLGREALAQAAERRGAGEAIDAIADSIGVSRKHLRSKLLHVERFGLSGVRAA